LTPCRRKNSFISCCTFGFVVTPVATQRLDVGSAFSWRMTSAAVLAVVLSSGPSEMLPLYQDPCFTFRFADDRLIPRFHLEGVGAGRRIEVFKIDPGSGERLDLLATGTVGDGGWVDLQVPIIMRAGEAFIAVPGRG
jgi:hypothetical protein